MKTHALVVAQDAHYLNWLENAGTAIAFSLARPIDADDLLSQIRAQGPVDLILFEFDAAEMESRAAMMEQVLDRMPEVVVAAIGAEPHPDVVLAAMRAGARDFLVLRRDDATLAAALGRLVRRGVAAAPSTATSSNAKRGRLYTMLSGHPHDGIAFTASHLALALAELQAGPGERVLLLDAATPPGAASIFLNLTPNYSVLDAVNDVYRCDQTLVDTAFARHSSGLYVLSLPEDLLGIPDLRTDDFLRLVTVLRGLFKSVVCAIDGQAPLPLLSGVLGSADRSLWLTDQSILRSRHSKYLLRALRLHDTPLSSAGLVVDAYQKRLGLEPSHLAELLDLPLVGMLGGDPAVRVQAMNVGESLFKIAPKDPFSLRIRELAAMLIAGEPTLPADRGGTLLKRWLG